MTSSPSSSLSSSSRAATSGQQVVARFEPALADQVGHVLLELTSARSPPPAAALTRSADVHQRAERALSVAGTPSSWQITATGTARRLVGQSAAAAAIRSSTRRRRGLDVGPQLLDPRE